jgi:hypothetical protein
MSSHPAPKACLSYFSQLYLESYVKGSSLVMYILKHEVGTIRRCLTLQFCSFGVVPTAFDPHYARP